jgi:hypothetical protein
MRYLLDANALIALAHTGHVFHAKARDWFRSVLFCGRHGPRLSPMHAWEKLFLRA